MPGWADGSQTWVNRHSTIVTYSSILAQKAHRPLSKRLSQATERHVMRPQNQFGKDRAAEFCLLQLAIESTQQLPKFWSRLKRRPAGQLAADSAEAAVLDLYLLVWFWGY